MNNAEKHLLLINAFAGMCFPLKNWPSILHDQGYSIWAIEWNFTNNQGKSVKPELILLSPARNCILLEAKSGTSDSDQMLKYAGISKEDIEVRAGLGAGINVFDVVYFTFDSNHEDAKRKIVSGGHSFPLLCLHDDRLTKALNDFSDKSINEKFDDPIRLDMKFLPHSLIPLSPDGSLPETVIIREMVMGICELLLSEVHPPVLDMAAFLDRYVIKTGLFNSFTRDDQVAMVKRCEAVMRKLIKQHFNEYLETVKRDGADLQPNKYRVIRSPRLSTSTGNLAIETRRVTRIAQDVLTQNDEVNGPRQQAFEGI